MIDVQMTKQCLTANLRERNTHAKRRNTQKKGLKRLKNSATILGSFSLNNLIILVLAFGFIYFAGESKVKEDKTPITLTEEQRQFEEAYWGRLKKLECGNHPTCCNTLPKDPGGETCFGLSASSHPHCLALAKGMIGSTEKVAMICIHEYYFVGMGIKALPISWIPYVLDYAIHSGVIAIFDLQRVIGIKADGVIGKKTIERLNKIKLYRKKYISKYIDIREKHLQQDRIHKGVFKDNFQKRIKVMRDRLRGSYESI